MKHSVSLNREVMVTGGASICTCGETFEGFEHSQLAFEHAMEAMRVDKICPSRSCAHYESSHDTVESEGEYATICYECQAPCSMEGE